LPFYSKRPWIKPWELIFRCDSWYVSLVTRRYQHCHSDIKGRGSYGVQQSCFWHCLLLLNTWRHFRYHWRLWLWFATRAPQDFPTGPPGEFHEGKTEPNVNKREDVDVCGNGAPWSKAPCRSNKTMETLHNEERHSSSSSPNTIRTPKSIRWVGSVARMGIWWMPRKF